MGDVYIQIVLLQLISDLAHIDSDNENNKRKLYLYVSGCAEKSSHTHTPVGYAFKTNQASAEVW